MRSPLSRYCAFGSLWKRKGNESCRSDMHLPVSLALRLSALQVECPPQPHMFPFLCHAHTHRLLCPPAGSLAGVKRTLWLVSAPRVRMELSGPALDCTVQLCWAGLLSQRAAVNPLHFGGSQALGQAGHFGALQWFSAVQQYSAKERERVLAAGAESQERGGQVSSTGTLGKLAGILTRGSAGSPDSPLGTGQQQALALELSRLAGFSAEFELLRDTLTAALAFFAKP